MANETASKVAGYLSNQDSRHQNRHVCI
ncbi:unnamed protein product [Arabidopsis thaliana]|uniref:Uncharacterized protein n=2 Tax=Arabidopsis thaliana TaxID=3702 RepID=A0A5S9WZR6_ARATH|nr:unnamed protein product [Arabidopsis thaliana]VYS52999.1 unnamed protein product [Arabidopsis thaliana]